jgi:hypothetical protein
MKMKTQADNSVLTGSCLCGSVTYQARAPFLRFAHCHCGRCRKATGTGHASNIYVNPAHFEWVTGRELAKRFDLPTARSFSTTFCTACGSPLPHHTRSGREMVIPAGSLDVAPGMSPQARIFWDSRVEWDGSADGVPTAGELPESWR